MIHVQKRSCDVSPRMVLFSLRKAKGGSKADHFCPKLMEALPPAQILEPAQGAALAKSMTAFTSSITS